MKQTVDGSYCEKLESPAKELGTIAANGIANSESLLFKEVHIYILVVLYMYFQIKWKFFCCSTYLYLFTIYLFICLSLLHAIYQSFNFIVQYANIPYWHTERIFG